MSPAPDFPALVAAARLRLGPIERQNPSEFSARVYRQMEEYRFCRRQGDTAGRLNAAAFLAARCEMHAEALAAVEAAAGRLLQSVPAASCPVPNGAAR